MRFNFKKVYKEEYLQKTEPMLIKISPINYLAVCGKGDPNLPDGEFCQAIEKLYTVAYTLKMSQKNQYKIDGFFDYVMPPLEAFWWQVGIEGVDYSQKEKFKFIALLRLPDFIKKLDFDWAIATAQKKRKKELHMVEYLTYDEGLCVQCMHIGSYDTEPETVAKMHKYIQEQGYVLDMQERYHHEIYLSDSRKCESYKLKTIIRHPIRKIE